MYNLLLLDYAPTLEQIRKTQRAGTGGLNILPLSLAASTPFWGNTLLVMSAGTLFLERH